MCKVTISAFQLIKAFPNEEAARNYLESLRWPDGPICPNCGSNDDQYCIKRKGVGGYFDCRACRTVYTVRTGTIFERSHVPLDKWMFAIYQVVTARKGISSLQLSKEIGVTQRTAWFMLQRIRKACEGDNLEGDFLFGIVEADEVYIGGKDKNRHESKKRGHGDDKTVVLGMRERAGNVKAQVVPDAGSNLKERVAETVCIGSVVCTDEHRSYQGLPDRTHKTVCHSAKEFVNGMAHTNGIESVWALLRRAFYGTYHSFSRKHTQLYLNEVCFRLNSGNVRAHTLERINSVLGMCFGRRLTFDTLVAG